MERIKKTKFFISIQKERKWLEDMAKEGYLLEDILMGVKYTFVKSFLNIFINLDIMSLFT